MVPIVQHKATPLARWCVAYCVLEAHVVRVTGAHDGKACFATRAPGISSLAVTAFRGYVPAVPDARGFAARNRPHSARRQTRLASRAPGTMRRLRFGAPCRRCRKRADLPRAAGGRRRRRLRRSWDAVGHS